MSKKRTPRPLLPIVRKPWQNGLGPYYVGLCLWIVYYDQLGLRALPVGGLGWSCLGAVIAGPLCYLLLYRVPAIWGQATGKTLPELAASTFGERGARWVPGALLGLAEVVWFAVAVNYGTDLTLKGLAEARLIDAHVLGGMTLGGFAIKGPVFLATSLLWCVAAGLVGRWLVRLIAAIMYVFPVFPAILLGGTMMAMLGGLRWFAPTGIDPLGLVAVPEARAGVWSMMLVAQLIFGFFAMAGATGADWGAATSTDRDVRIGGWVGACVAPIVIATIGLITVAGYQGRVNAPSTAVEAQAEASGRVIDPYALRRQADLASSTSTIETLGRDHEWTFRAVLTDGVGGRVGCAMLLVFGVAALAPAVFSSFVLGHRLHAAVPALSRTRWTLIGAALAWLVVASGKADRLEAVFTLMGALFAPMVACMAADYSRRKGVWPGPRRGVNAPGLVGWLVGMLVGLLPFFTRGKSSSLQPAAFWAFLAGFAAYTIVARLSGESAPVGEAIKVEPVAVASEVPPPG